MFVGRLTGFTITSCLCLLLSGPLLPAARGAVTLPGNQVVEEVDFERHLMGVLGRMGCNAGSCHGSFQGKGGFRLSLFGYDPAMDYAALTREQMGRRINPVEPDRSLFLLKATGQIEHGGGRRFGRDSWQYRLFREWIVKGARWEKGSGAVSSLKVSPAEFASIKPQQTNQVRVLARFADGSEEDVTILSDFRVQDDAIAELQGPGKVKALRPGDTALVVSYRGNVRAIRILVPMPARSGGAYPKVPETNYIDREVFAKLRQLNMVPSDVASDTEFLRRVTIDTIACLPSPEEVRAFLADKSPHKRTKKIEELLAHPLHAALWATKFSDITGNNTNLLRFVKGKGVRPDVYSQMWHDWFRKRLAANMPYDEIARGVVCATSRDGKTPEEWLQQTREIEAAAEKGFETPYPEKPSLDLYWCLGRLMKLEQLGERTAAAFLGIRLECAQCHKHPFDRWTQADYRSFANIFGQVVVGPSPEVTQALVKQNAPLKVKGKKYQGPGALEVHVSLKARQLPNPDFPPVVLAFNKKKKPIFSKAQPLPAKALGGPEFPLERGKDARVAFFEWLRSPDNAYFARSFVNRVWGHYFGVGLVDPVDDFSLANPPSNPRLLDALARDFIAHKFDIRQLERTVLNSRVYQLTSAPNETNKLDRNNYSHSYLRPMIAEAVVDVLHSALGMTEFFGKGSPVPPGKRAIEIGSSLIFNPDLAIAYRTFGRPTRALVCDCERPRQAALAQTLYFMADPSVVNKIRNSAKPIILARLKPQPPKGKVKPQPPQGKGKPQVLKGKGKPQPPEDKAKSKPQPPEDKGKLLLPKPKSKQAATPAEAKGHALQDPKQGKGQDQAPPKKSTQPVPPKGKTKLPASLPPKKGQPLLELGLVKKLLVPALPPAKKKGKPAPVKVKVKSKAKPGKGKIKQVFVPVQEGRLAKLLKSTKTDDEILEELFLATLTRFPTAAEKEYFEKYRAAKKARSASVAADAPKNKKVKGPALNEREALFVDVLWALINTREFVLNH
jgi:hypothetical protein